MAAPGAALKWIAWIGLVLVAFVAAGWIVVESQFSMAPLDEYIGDVRAAGRPVTVAEAVGPDPDPDTNGAADLVRGSASLGAPNLDHVVRAESEWPGSSWLDDAADDDGGGLFEDRASTATFMEAVDAALAKPRLRILAASGPAWSRAVDFLAVRGSSGPSPARITAVERLAALALKRECGGPRDHADAAAVMIDAVLCVRVLTRRSDFRAADGRARLDASLAAPWLRRFGDAVRVHRAEVLEAAQRGDIDRFLYSNPGKSSDLSVAADRPGAVLKAWRYGRRAPRGSPAELANNLAECEPFESVSTDSYVSLAAAISAVPNGASNRMVMGPIRTLAPRLARTDAICRLARIALAAAEHRQTRGDWPASLAELAWAFPDGVPLDPFTDADFVYTKTDAGVRIASLGRLTEDPPLDEETLRERVLVWELRR